MEISANQHREVVILQLQGSFEDKHCEAFNECVAQVLQQGIRRVVIDLESTHHISGAGIRALIALNKRLDGLDKGLVLSSMSPEVRRSFDVSGFAERFTIVQDCTTAVQQQLAQEKVSQISSRAARLLAKKQSSEP